MSYEDLPFEELRDKTFAVAEKRHDLGFFYDLFKHTPSMQAASAEGGSLGDISGTLVDLVSASREEFTEENLGDMQPLFVARFATYLRDHDTD